MTTGWVPVGVAAEGDVQRAVVDGRPYAVVKLRGWAVLSDQCPHRFTPLSAGRVVDTGQGPRLQCPYHGWQFDDRGTCALIPAQGPGGRIPARAATAEAGAAAEHAGVVWACFGPPIDPPEWVSLGGSGVARRVVAEPFPSFAARTIAEGWSSPSPASAPGLFTNGTDRWLAGVARDDTSLTVFSGPLSQEAP